MAKNMPANAGDIRDTGFIPDQEDPLEEGMTTHSSILAWRIPWTEEPVRLQSLGCKESDTTGSNLALMHGRDKEEGGPEGREFSDYDANLTPVMKSRKEGELDRKNLPQKFSSRPTGTLVTQVIH